MGEDDLTPAEPLSAPARASERRERFLRWLAQHMISQAKTWLPPLLALMAAAAQHWAGKAETDKKLDVGYKTNEQVITVHAAELDDLKRGLAQVTDSVQVLQKLALSGQPGFNTTGAPVQVAAVVVGQRKRTHVLVPPADPTLVKKLQENQAKNLKLQAHLEAKAPPSPSVPPSLPAEVPPVPAAPPAVAPPAKPPAQEWPPPVPTQPVQREAGVQ